MSPIRSELSNRIIGHAITVHREVGPGLFESVYQRCFAHELTLHGIHFVQQAPVPLTYKGLTFPWSYRADFWIENEIVVELKTVDKILPLHRAQVLTYMRLLNASSGLLFNFSSARLADGGIASMVPLRFWPTP